MGDFSRLITTHAAFRGVGYTLPKSLDLLLLPFYVCKISLLELDNRVIDYIHRTNTCRIFASLSFLTILKMLEGCESIPRTCLFTLAPLAKTVMGIVTGPLAWSMRADLGPPAG